MMKVIGRTRPATETLILKSSVFVSAFIKM